MKKYFSLILYIWPIPLFWFIDWYFVILCYNITFTGLSLYFYFSKDFYTKNYSLIKIIFFPLILGLIGFIVTALESQNQKKNLQKNKSFTNTENSDKTHIKNNFETSDSEKLAFIKKKISSGDYIDIDEYILFNRIKDIHELRESLKTDEFDEIYIKQSFGIRHPIIQFTSNEYLDDSFTKSSKEEYFSELEYNLSSLFNKNEDNGKDYFKKDELELFRIVKKKKSEVLNEIDNYIQNDLNNSEDIDSIKNYIDNYIQNTDLDHWNDWSDSDFLYPPCGIDFESTSIDSLIPASEIFSHISYQLIYTFEIDGILMKIK